VWGWKEREFNTSPSPTKPHTHYEGKKIIHRDISRIQQETRMGGGIMKNGGIMRRRGLIKVCVSGSYTSTAGSSSSTFLSLPVMTGGGGGKHDSRIYPHKIVPSQLPPPTHVWRGGEGDLGEGDRAPPAETRAPPRLTPPSSKPPS
jgi:hypothetical protein